MYRSDLPAYWQGQLAEWGPRLLVALLILVATHFIAKAVQWAIKRLVEKVPALQKDPDQDGSSIGTELGRLGYWLVWLVGLVAALEPLGLSDVLTPVTRMTNEVFGFLPNLIGAVVIFAVGLIIAKVARHIVEAALRALNIEDWAARAGLPMGEKPVNVTAEGEASEGAAPARHSIAKAAGMTVSAIIIVSASIAALQALQIEAISGPATDMLEVIALAIPKVIAGLLWLAIAFVIGRWVKSLIETILPSLGFDAAMRSIGVMNEGAQPSRIVGAVAFVAVMLAAAIEAMRSIGGDSVAALLFQITELGGKVIFGTVIIVVGLFLSRLIARIVGQGAGEGSYAETIVKYAIIALFTAIGLTFMGLANEIVILAFGLILGSAAVATALAFGLGGRDAAGRMLERWQSERAGAPQPPARPKKLPRADRSGGDDGSQPPLV
ncbi:mechanosensitive ion channel [Sphingomicrobium astaxanthinifaciens]|uniref:mechanosensitive ion channel n=1 Tax=Sphingomicrobium astaxanthinifaciens TaxID=1227949 RepID=UPI001FCAB440|nr:mechanosensitive ion channel [Sphingomicrobium astaxanthinifaciens]MCJ7420752.1 mechanosensitive ion channel [Sphingomicrobium astaxanthinifaciens]